MNVAPNLEICFTGNPYMKPPFHQMVVTEYNSDQKHTTACDYCGFSSDHQPHGSIPILTAHFSTLGRYIKK